jgi:hypothetical protein
MRSIAPPGADEDKSRYTGEVRRLALTSRERVRGIPQPGDFIDAPIARLAGDGGPRVLRQSSQYALPPSRTPSKPFLNQPCA